jgi:hypothetical protein
MQQNALTPTLLWYQDPFFVHFTILVQNVKDETIVINENNFLFKSNTTPNYLIEFDLLNNINKEESTYVVKEKNIKVMLKKIGSDKWSSLTSNRNIYKNNIKIDWDSWYDSDAEEVENLPMSRNDFSNVDFSSMMQQMQGMGGMNNFMPNMGNDNDEEEDTENETEKMENMGENMEELMKQIDGMSSSEMEEFMKNMEGLNEDECEDGECEEDGNCEECDQEAVCEEEEGISEEDSD